MSKASTSIKPYTIDEINKKLLAKPPKVHLPSEIIGHDDKYRDDDYETYKLKCKEFLEAAKKYQELNKEALCNSKHKLDWDTDGLYKYKTCSTIPQSCGNSPNAKGLLVRKRYLRPIHKESEEEVDICWMERWHGRLFKLCKFIQAARTVIIKNRMLKRLEILNALHEDTVDELEAAHIRFRNVSYSEIFDKFCSKE